MSAKVSYSTWSNFTTQRSLRRAFDAAVNGGDVFLVVKGGTLRCACPGPDNTGEIVVPYDKEHIKMVFRRAQLGDVVDKELDLGGMTRDALFQELGCLDSRKVISLKFGERSCVVAANIGVGESLDKVSYADFRVALVMASCNERGLNA